MRIGWIVVGWTGRVWTPFHDTHARTRSEAVRKWCEPLRDDGRPLYEKLRRMGCLKAVRTHVFDPDA